MASPRMNRLSSPDEATRALRSMQSITNVGGLTDEGLDIAQGFGDFMPSEVELKGAQRATGGAISREDLRKGAMGQIKRMLGLKAQEHQDKLELGQQKIQAEAQARAAQNDAILARQREMAEIAAANREQQMQDQQNFQQSMAAEKMALDREKFEHEKTKQPTSRTTAPTASMLQSAGDARSYYGSPKARVARMIGFGGGKTEYQGSLEAILHRAGSLGPLQEAAKEAQASGMGAAQAIAEAEAQGVALDVYEKQYLELLLGQ